MRVILLILLILLTPPARAPWPALTLTAQPGTSPGVTRLTLHASGSGQLGLLLTRGDMALAPTTGSGTAGTVCRSLWIDPEDARGMRVWLACGWDLDMAGAGTITLDIPGDAADVDVWLQWGGERRRETWVVARGARLAPHSYAPLAGVGDAPPIAQSAQSTQSTPAPDPARILDLCGHIPDNGAPWYMEDGWGNPQPCPGDAPPPPSPTPTPEPAYPVRQWLAPVWR